MARKKQKTVREMLEEILRRIDKLERDVVQDNKPKPASPPDPNPWVRPYTPPWKDPYHPRGECPPQQPTNTPPWPLPTITCGNTPH